MIKKLKEKIPFPVNYIGFAKRDGLHFLDIELPDHDLKTIETKTLTISKIVDELNPYEHSYFLNVYSAGTEQVLALDQLDQHLFAHVALATNKPYVQRQNWEGQLIAHDPQSLILVVNNKGRMQKITFNKSDINFLKLSAKLTKEPN